MRRFYAPPCYLLAIVLSLTGAPLTAQEEREIRTVPSCPNCRIAIERVTTLGDDDEGFVGFTQMVLEFGDRYVLTHHDAPSEILVFGRDGRFVQRVGGRGDGPGEFRRIAGLTVSVGDSLIAAEAANARYTVFGPDLSFARSGRLLSTVLENGLLARSDGAGLLVNGFSPGVPQDSSLVHSFSWTGERHSLDVPLAGARPDHAPLPYRWLVPSDSSHFWVIHYDRYRIERRDLEGRLASVLVGSPTWFGWVPSGDPTHGKQERQPYLLDAFEDDQGRLWILGESPELWRNGEREAPDLSVLEVIDPQTGALIARGRFDGAIRGFVRPGLAFAYREVGEGLPRIDILSVELLRENQIRPKERR